jgi:hypothetical protein
MTNRNEVLKRLYELEEYKVVQHVHELNQINKIHSQNFNSLRSHLEKLFDLQSSMSGNYFNTSIHSKIEKRNYDQYLSQYLNNYLSSAFSVVDYSRKHYEKYYNNGKLTGYIDKVKTEFSNNEKHRFMQDFRNYALHYGIPQLSTVKQVKPNKNEWDTKHYISLNLKNLFNSSFEWKSLSKTFYENRKSDEIELLPFLDNYFNQLNNFQKWYKKEQQELFKLEFSKIEKAENEFSLIMFKNLMNYIYSGKGYSFQLVESNLLYCFTFDCQLEVLSVNDTDERLHLMFTKLKSKIAIPHQDIMILQITLNQNKENIKIVK